MDNKHPPSPWLNTDQAAAYLGASPKTLAIWRSKGKGPQYHIVNERLVRYHVRELDAHVFNRPGGGSPSSHTENQSTPSPSKR